VNAANHLVERREADRTESVDLGGNYVIADIGGAYFEKDLFAGRF
jgi:hypothetical protein